MAGINDYIKIGKKIKQVRIKSGISQKDMAMRLGISQSSWSNYENGYREPGINLIYLFCKEMGVTIDELIWMEIMTIGENIKKYREKKGLTQKELGAALGLAEITIRQYESNKREPKYEILFSIADALNVSIDDLMNIDTGKRIKEERVKAKLTQEKLAQSAEISVFTLQKYESGDRNPKIEQLKKIANALGISITQLKII